jgi:exodeoxyribonuclease V alpha subunit
MATLWDKPVVTNEVTVEGEVARITFENESTGFRIVKLAQPGSSDRITLIGSMPRLAVGTTVRVRGTQENDPKHGAQIRVLGVTELAPNTLIGLERYLGSGLIAGIGQAYASRIVQTFGLETLRILDEAPWRLHEVAGLGKKRIEAVAKSWVEQRQAREAMLFLEGHGCSPALAMRVWKRYAKETVRLVQEDPYRLAIDVWGIGFRTADRIAASLGIAKDADKRVQAGLLQTLRDTETAGHVFLTEGALFEQTERLLGAESTIAYEKFRAARLELEALRLAVSEGEGSECIVYFTPLYNAEVFLAHAIAERLARKAPSLGDAAEVLARFERDARVSLAPAQRHAVDLAAQHGVLVITGGPGVGKTTLVRALLALLTAKGLIARLAAPTGRAAKRMSEATGQEATTIHRLLDFDPRTGAFKRDQDNPLEGAALIVDEMSMVDLPLAASLIAAAAPGMRLILVGDVDQLASVGPGAILRDLIDSGAVPCVRLTQIFRQGDGSLIVENAHRINAGQAPQVSKSADADFFIIQRTDAELAKQTVLELVTRRIPDKFGLDPVRDIQVLVPMHKGAAGSQALNAALQAALRPAGGSTGAEGEVVREGRSFRVGDKVMQLRNDYDRNVYNGDVGFVETADNEAGQLQVRFDEARLANYDSGNLDELMLAYACSIHKSQGSEYPAVVIPLLSSHFVMLSRNLLYTAVTRGKRLVVLVADPRALRLALSKLRIDDRKTRLRERLLEAVQHNVLAP